MLISYYFCTAYSLSVFTLPKCVLFAFYFRQLAFELCKRLLTSNLALTNYPVQRDLE